MLFVFVVMFGCTGTPEGPMNANLPLVLEGVWVDKKTGTDTLEFLRLEDGSSLMILKRGWEFRNGYDLPKMGSGPYSFVLARNKISLHYSLSSSYKFFDYDFEYNPLQVKIGRFFESDNSSSVLTFRKVN